MKFSPIFLQMTDLQDSPTSGKSFKLSDSKYLFSDIIKVHLDQEAGNSEKNTECNNLTDNKNFTLPGFNLTFNLINNKLSNPQKNDPPDKNSLKTNQPDASLSSIINLINQFSYSAPGQPEDNTPTQNPVKYLTGFELKEIIKKIAYLSGSIDYNQFLSDDNNSDSGKIKSPEQLLDYLKENNKAVINVIADNQDLKIELTGKKADDSSYLHDFVLFDQNTNELPDAGKVLSNQNVNPAESDENELQSPGIASNPDLAVENDSGKQLTDVQALSKQINNTSIPNIENQGKIPVQQHIKPGVIEKTKVASDGGKIFDSIILNPVDEQDPVIIPINNADQNSDNKMFEVKVTLKNSVKPVETEVHSKENLSVFNNNTSNVEINLEPQNKPVEKRSAVNVIAKKNIVYNNTKESSLSFKQLQNDVVAENNYQPENQKTFQEVFPGLNNNKTEYNKANITDYAVKNLLKYSTSQVEENDYENASSSSLENTNQKDITAKLSENQKSYDPGNANEGIKDQNYPEALKEKVEYLKNPDDQQKDLTKIISEYNTQNLNENDIEKSIVFETETIATEDLKIFKQSADVKKDGQETSKQSEIKISKPDTSQKSGSNKFQLNKNTGPGDTQNYPVEKNDNSSSAAKQEAAGTGNLSSKSNLQSPPSFKFNPVVNPLEVNLNNSSNNAGNDTSDEKKDTGENQEVQEIKGVIDNQTIGKGEKAEQGDKQKNQSDEADISKQFNANSLVQDKTSQKIPVDNKILDNKNFQDLKENIKTVSTSKIINEISNLAESKTSKNVVLKLSPEDLGKVKISLDVSNNHVHVNVEVENEMVKNLIHSNSAQLRQSFVQNGLQLNSLNISLANSEQKPDKNFSSKKKTNYNTVVKEIEIKNNINVPRKMGYNTYEFLA